MDFDTFSPEIQKEVECRVRRGMLKSVDYNPKVLLYQ